MIKILTGAHTRVKIYQTDLIRQYFESMCFLTKKSPTHGQKSRQNIDANFFLQNIDVFFDRVWAPLGLSFCFIYLQAS